MWKTRSIQHFHENLFGRTNVVTGANSGIGRASADALAARGARVILACRNEEEGVKASEEIVRATYKMALDPISFE